MPKKTLYVKDADLPIWEAAEKILGEKSMSTFVVEALRAKLNNPRDGFLNILCANTGVPLRRAQFAVMFAPTDIVGGVMKPHYCSDLEALKTFLGALGLTGTAVAEIVAELGAKYSSSVRISLTEEKIALI
jgi:hypothetical protein